MKRIILIGAFLLLASPAFATTYNTPDCESATVMTYIGMATTGDTINIHSGSCTWANGSVVLDKAITLNGAGVASTIITTGVNNSFDVTKSASGLIWVTNIRFISMNDNSRPRPIYVHGSWTGAEPVIFQHDKFNYGVPSECYSGPTPTGIFVCGSGNMMDISVPGGVIMASNEWDTDQTNAFGFEINDIADDGSWTTADSIGTNDTDGKLNVYLEDNTVNGGPNGWFDCADNCRVVVRHNTLNQSGGVQGHGRDSSAYGTRHFEVYNNAFHFTAADMGAPACDVAGTYLGNLAQGYIWVRGGTGVIFSNSFDDINSGACYGDQSETLYSVRSAEDDRIQGPPPHTCADVSYPIPGQAGQNYAPSAYFTDPVTLWLNTGTFNAVYRRFTDPYPCEAYYTMPTYVWQLNRDYVLSGGDGKGSTPKMGYTAYPYPHPLLSACVPDHLAFTGQPGSVAVGALLGTVSVVIYDSNDVPCDTATDTITIANKGGTCTGMTLGGTASGAASSGVFTTTNLTENAAGACTLSATASGLTGADSSAFTISAVSGLGLTIRLRLKGFVN